MKYSTLELLSDTKNPAINSLSKQLVKTAMDKHSDPDKQLELAKKLVDHVHATLLKMVEIEHKHATTKEVK